MSFDLSADDVLLLGRHYAPGLSPDTLRAQLRRRAANRGDAALALGGATVGALDTAILGLARQGLPTNELAERWGDAVEAALAKLASNTPAEAAPRPTFRLPILNQPRALGGPIVCGVHVDADDGVSRVRVRCWRLNGVIASYASVEVKHYRKGNNGYEKKKADHLEVTGSVFLTPAGGVPQEATISRSQNNVKETHKRYAYVGTALIEFVEGCGGVSPSSPLWACACSGSFGGGAVGGGPGGGGGDIIDGG